MRSTPDPQAQRARRQLRWYPKDWRSRYGEEFAELLVSEMEDKPRSVSRDVNVAWSGIVARVSDAGLGATMADPVAGARASLASVGCALAVFLAFGISVWAQLTVDWQWSPPRTAGTYLGMILMSFAVLILCVLVLIGATPIAWSVLKRLITGEPKGLIAPTSVFLSCVLMFVIGSRHFENGWPGTGGHVWAQQGIVPGGIAAFTWAATLSVTSYWAHPGFLLSFPRLELAWMLVSPLLMVGMVVGAAKTVRRLDLSSRVLGYEANVARASGFATILFFAGSASWVLNGGAGEKRLFSTGGIDIAALVIMGLAVGVAWRATRRALQWGAVTEVV